MMSQAEDTEGANPDDLRAKLFRDRERPDDWRVEKMDEGGGIEVALFSGGADPRQRAIAYAERVYGDFDEIELHPYHRAPPLGQVLDDLSRSGIPVTLENMPDDPGYMFYLGETGDIEGHAESVFTLGLGLCAYAVENFPDSPFAAEYRGKTF
jgi:hypothetical protein